MNNPPRLLPLLVVLFGLAASAAAQSGQIVGTIIDAETGDPLIGAFAVVRNPDGTATNYGTATDLAGDFRIVGVPAGTYALESSMIGYNKVTITGVVVEADGVAELDFALQSEAISLDEVVVEARAVRTTEAALLRERQKAPAVSDAISAEDISRAGAGDAADAMTHVTGASVQEGKYVVIRGLGDRYSTVQLNGAELPSADPDKRSVPIDMFPSSMLENIVTVKSFTPDKPGNFTGGAVNIGTRTFPNSFLVSVSTSTKYNTQTSFQDVLTYPGGGTGLLATDGSDRELASVVPAEGEVPPLAATVPQDVLLLDAVMKSFSPVMSPTQETAALDHSSAFAIGDQFQLGGRPVGFLASLSHSHSRSSYDDGIQASYKRARSVQASLDDLLFLNDAKSTEETALGGLFTLAYRPGDRHELGVSYVANRSATDVARSMEGSWEEQSIENFRSRVISYSEREIQSLQFSGKHQLAAARDVRAEWMLSRSRSTQIEPDLRQFADQVSAVTGRINLHQAAAPTRFYRDLEDGNLEGRLDLSMRFKQWSGLSGQLKAGSLLQSKERDFAERAFLYRSGGDPSAGYPVRFRDLGEAWFAAPNVGIVAVDTTFIDPSVGILDTTRTFDRSGGVVYGTKIEEPPDVAGNYHGDQRIDAYYGMVELPLSPTLRLITGARLEATDIEVVSEDVDKAPGILKETDLLPSVSLVRQVGEMNVRLSYGRTLARPTMREVSPFSSTDFFGGSAISGNPDLERTLVDNYDVRWEWFPRPGEIYAVSAFWKEFENPIERSFQSENRDVTYVNVDHARVFGAEFEARKNLSALGPRYRNFFAGGNLSIVHSNVDIPEEALEQIRGIDSTASSSRQLQGQSPYVVNLDLSYDSFERGVSAGLYLNVFGKRLATVSAGATPDVFEKPYASLDFTFAKDVFGFYRVKVGARNLLDSTHEQVYEYRGRESISSRYKSGRTLSIGVSYKLGS